MFPFLIKLKNLILDIFFPPICINCQQFLDDKNKLICEQCLSLIKLNNTLFCPVCRARLADNKRICHYDSQYLLAAAGNYDDLVLQNLIHYFKYKSFKNLAPVLGEILIKYLQKSQLINQSIDKPINYIVVSIPLHPRRERQRGFNQAELLAEIIAQNFNLELCGVLKRTKNNEPQAKIKDNETRAKNMAGCFEINPHTKRTHTLFSARGASVRYGVGVENPIRGKNILLIDDVFTSGATMNEAVKILKQNNARKIIALVLAKA